MIDLLGRFRYPLTYLLLVALCVITMTAPPSGAGLGAGSRLVLGLAVPLERMVTLPVGALRDLWRGYVALVDVENENELLRQENERLREANLRYQEAIVASERFRGLDRFRERGDVPMVPANVIGVDLSTWFRSVILDQGAGAGIRAGMPVITERGVVGMVAGTTPAAAKVLLAIDPQSRIDATVQRTRARGSVRGRSSHVCDFEYVLREEDVRSGDLLLTSGLDGLYPKGLRIGEITHIERQPYGLFQRAEVKPAVDFGKLEEVFVILERRELPDAETFTTGDDALWGERPE